MLFFATFIILNVSHHIECFSGCLERAVGFKVKQVADSKELNSQQR